MPFSMYNIYSSTATTSRSTAVLETFRNNNSFSHSCHVRCRALLNVPLERLHGFAYVALKPGQHRAQAEQKARAAGEALSGLEVKCTELETQVRCSLRVGYPASGSLFVLFFPGPKIATTLMVRRVLSLVQRHSSKLVLLLLFCCVVVVVGYIPYLLSAKMRLTWGPGRVGGHPSARVV